MYNLYKNTHFPQLQGKIKSGLIFKNLTQFDGKSWVNITGENSQYPDLPKSNKFALQVERGVHIADGAQRRSTRAKVNAKLKDFGKWLVHVKGTSQGSL